MARGGHERGEERPASADVHARPRILYLVRRWSVAARDRLEEITRRHGLSAGDYALLSFIGRLGPCSAAEIARSLHITPQAAAQRVVQLEGKQLVSRYANNANRRITLIALTEAGGAACRDIDRRADALEAEMTRGLDPGQLAIIETFLSRRP